MRFLEIARALDDQAMWHETQAWLEAQATSAPRRKHRRYKRPKVKSPVPQQARFAAPSRPPALPSSQSVLRPTHSSSFSQADLHLVHQGYVASLGDRNS